MITATQKKKIIAALGKHYTARVLAHLNKRKIYNSEGKAFIGESIVKFVNGKREHIEAETAILKLAAAEKARKDKLAKQRKSILR